MWEQETEIEEFNDSGPELPKVNPIDAFGEDYDEENEVPF